VVDLTGRIGSDAEERKPNSWHGGGAFGPTWWRPPFYGRRSRLHTRGLHEQWRQQ
jgi:hypothetical protein